MPIHELVVEWSFQGTPFTPPPQREDPDDYDCWLGVPDDYEDY